MTSGGEGGEGSRGGGQDVPHADKRLLRRARKAVRAHYPCAVTTTVSPLLLTSHPPLLKARSTRARQIPLCARSCAARPGLAGVVSSERTKTKKE
jgi:hypothetical protein